MIKGKTVLAIIPARGGSKGVVHKNIHEVAGKPLIAWTIEEAKKSRYIDRLILTSDDVEIIAVAQKWGCEVPFTRPKELALDDTPGIEPILHAIHNMPKYDYIVMLQPTSPLRSVVDIDSSLELCEVQGSNSCVSVTAPDKSPYWMYTLDESSKMTPLLQVKEAIKRRQDLPNIVALNGAVYVANSDWLLENKAFVTTDTIAYTMPKLRSLDIDTELDLQIAEFIIKSSLAE
jgi:CMP-N,N'-diacetyllegionaminic acid synthase